MLAHMMASQRSTYTTVAEALRRRFGSVFQAEVHREQLKGRTRQQGESLPQLAQAVESLVRHVYPVVPEEMVTVLSRDAFVDALEDQQVQIYVKQAHPADVQQALARAMEFEAFLYTTTTAVTPHHRFAAQKSPRRHLPCGKRGHRRSDCCSERRTRSLEDVRARSPTKACCKNFGRWGHRRDVCSQLKDVMMVGGDESRLGVRATVQPSRPRVCLCKVLQQRYCAGGPSVRRSGRPLLCGVTGHCMTLRGPMMSTITVGVVEEKLSVFVANMEEPCLLGLDFLVQSEACMDLGRMRMQVERPVTSSDVEDEKLELQC
ncbi:hypothetical protein E2C01_049261 [Portunus trituberculatus]|uniref:Uncharacterized protein n=1 Tax=Portunus trituberculatus TaxID=210409 RepID=A0A5B7GDR9_PORTR|nr:hypothetical protein [Portunus trituberculatus]